MEQNGLKRPFDARNSLVPIPYIISQQWPSLVQNQENLVSPTHVLVLLLSEFHALDVAGPVQALHEAKDNRLQFRFSGRYK
jgi:hypothetical protein